MHMGAAPEPCTLTRVMNSNGECVVVQPRVQDPMHLLSRGAGEDSSSWGSPAGVQVLTLAVENKRARSAGSAEGLRGPPGKQCEVAP